MPRKTKDTKPKTKVKAKAKASAKVVSNIQNKIIIGDVSKKKRAPRKSKKPVPSGPYIPTTQFSPSQPFVSYQTRLLDEQPKVNLLTERVNKLELASLYRPALPAPEARGMLEAPPAAPKQGMLEDVNYMDYYTRYYNPIMETPLIANEKTKPLDTNMFRTPAADKKPRNDLIDNPSNVTIEELNTIPRYEDVDVETITEKVSPSGAVTYDVVPNSNQTITVETKEYKRLKKLQTKYSNQVDSLETELAAGPDEERRKEIEKAIKTNQKKLKKVNDEMFNVPS